MRKLFSCILAAGLAGPCIAVAANLPPKFNVAPGCKAAAAINQVMDLSVSQNYTSCMEDEEDARQQLVRNWASFSPKDQARCVGQTQVNGMPSYAEVLACLQVTANSPLVSPEKKSRPDSKIENTSEKTNRPDTKKETTSDKANDLNQTIAALRADLANSTRRISELERENGELKNSEASLKTSLAASADTIAQLQRKNSEADGALRKAEQERLSIQNQLHEVEGLRASSTAGEHDTGRDWQNLAYGASGGLVILLIIDASYLWARRKRAKRTANPGVKGELLPFGVKADVTTAVADTSANAGNRPMAVGTRSRQDSGMLETVSN